MMNDRSGDWFQKTPGTFAIRVPAKQAPDTQQQPTPHRIGFDDTVVRMPPGQTQNQPR